MAKQKAADKVIEAMRNGERLYQRSFQYVAFLWKDDPERPGRVVERRVAQTTMDQLLATKLIVEVPSTSKRKTGRHDYWLADVYAQNYPENPWCRCLHRKENHDHGGGSCRMDNGREFEPCNCCRFELLTHVESIRSMDEMEKVKFSIPGHDRGSYE